MSSWGNSWSLFCVRYAILLKHSSRYSRITNFCNDQWKNELVQKHDNSTRLSNLLFLIKHHAYVLAGSEPEILVPWGDYLRLPCRIRIPNFLVSELQLHVNSITAATYFCLNRFIFYMEMFNGWIIVPEEDSQTFYSSWTIPLGLGVWVHDKKKNQPFYERWVYQGQVWNKYWEHLIEN